MKNSILVFIFSSFSGIALAEQCYAIRDADQRNFCEGKCYAIRDYDLRRTCEADKKGEPAPSSPSKKNVHSQYERGMSATRFISDTGTPTKRLSPATSVGSLTALGFR